MITAEQVCRGCRASVGLVIVCTDRSEATIAMTPTGALQGCVTVDAVDLMYCLTDQLGRILQWFHCFNWCLVLVQKLQPEGFLNCFFET